MPIEQMSSFSQILASLNLRQEEMPFEEKVKNEELLPSAKDSIELSIQARKALGTSLPDTGKVEPATEIAQPATQFDAQGNRVRISPEGNALASSQAGKVAWETRLDNNAPGASEIDRARNLAGSAVLDSGAKVSIYTAGFDGGDEKAHAGAADNKLIAEISRADGSTETLVIRSNTVISEDAEGNLIVNSVFESFGQETELNGTSGSDVIINLNGAANINCGEGNDTVISFNNINNLDLGSGNNHFYASASATTSNIFAKAGNNNIQIDNKDTKTNINIGDGNNEIYSMSELNLTAGNGNNKIYINSRDNLYSESSLVLGEGDNYINVTGKYNFVKDIKLGNGNNQINIDSIVSNSLSIGDGQNNISMGKGFGTGNLNPLTGIIQDIPGLSGPLSIRYAEINIGHGNNSLDFYTLYGHMTVGNGNNDVSSFRSLIPSYITFGNGDNKLNATSYLDVSSLNFGEGNNTINANHLAGSITFGSGNNTVNSNSVYMARLNTGNGNNNLNFTYLGYGTINMGSGNDTINISANIDQQSYINLGAGNDNLTINGNVNRLTLVSGEGEDNIIIKGDVTDSNIISGSGQENSEPSRDRISIYKNLYNSSILSDSRLSEINVHGTLINSIINKPK